MLYSKSYRLTRIRKCVFRISVFILFIVEFEIAKRKIVNMYKHVIAVCVNISCEYKHEYRYMHMNSSDYSVLRPFLAPGCDQGP